MDESPIEIESAKPDNFRRRWSAPLPVVALSATLLVVPMLLGHPSGHDLQPHLASWMEIQGQWRQGISFPRWAEWSNFGFGEPRFIFYPPSSAFIGAALGSILPWKIVPSVLTWLTLFAAGVFMYKLANDWLAPQQAVMAAVLFVANPYNLIVIYYRSAFAELMAAAFFPLIIWGVIRSARGEWKCLSLVAACFAAICLTNAPAAVIAGYTVVLVLAVCCIVRRRFQPLIPLAIAFAIGLGVAAVYLVPAWWERRWIDLASLISADGNPERNFLFSLNNYPIFLKFNWIISAIAVCLMLLTAIAIVLSPRTLRRGSDVWWTMVVLALSSSLLMFSVSKLLWRDLPELQFLQFPWRWLIVLTVPFAVLVASVARVKTILFWIVAVFICTAPLALAVKVKWGGHDATTVAEMFASGAGYFSTTNFTPIGSSRFTLPERAPLLQKVGANGDLVDLNDVKMQIRRWSAERKVFWVEAKEEVTLALKLLNYPPWQVSINGQPAGVRSFDRTGQMLITVPEGEHQIDVHFTRTRDRAIGGMISIVSLIVLLTVTAVFSWHGLKRQGYDPS